MHDDRQTTDGQTTLRKMCRSRHIAISGITYRTAMPSQFGTRFFKCYNNRITVVAVAILFLFGDVVGRRSFNASALMAFARGH